MTKRVILLLMNCGIVLKFVIYTNKNYYTKMNTPTLLTHIKCQGLKLPNIK